MEILMVELSVKRGPQSWNYIYIMLGFALSIEGSVIQMIQAPPLWSIVSYLVTAVITAWAFLDSRWMHDKLVRLKIRYEEKER
jgi:hypothetical protein